MRYAVQVPLAVASMFDARLNQDRVTGATPLCTFLTLLTGGYFVTESLIICRNFEEHGVEPLAHAAVCVCFFLLVAFTKKMQWFVPRVLFFECSTPLVHLRWLLQSLGLGETTFYKVNGISMMAAFFVCRVVWGTSASPVLLYIMFASSFLGITPHMGVWLLDVECSRCTCAHVHIAPHINVLGVSSTSTTHVCVRPMALSQMRNHCPRHLTTCWCFLDTFTPSARVDVVLS
jgi:hypothetical protein